MRVDVGVEASHFDDPVDPTVHGRLTFLSTVELVQGGFERQSDSDVEVEEDFAG